MCCIFKRTNRCQNDDRRFYSSLTCRKTPRMKRYLENDLNALASNDNNCCCRCGCCPCCCELAYSNNRSDTHYDTCHDGCHDNFKTFTPESFCTSNHDDYC